MPNRAPRHHSRRCAQAALVLPAESSAPAPEWQAAAVMTATQINVRTVWLVFIGSYLLLKLHRSLVFPFVPARLFGLNGSTSMLTNATPTPSGAASQNLNSRWSPVLKSFSSSYSSSSSIRRRIWENPPYDLLNPESGCIVWDTEFTTHLGNLPFAISFCATRPRTTPVVPSSRLSHSSLPSHLSFLRPKILKGSIIHPRTKTRPTSLARPVVLRSVVLQSRSREPPQSASAGLLLILP